MNDLELKEESNRSLLSVLAIVVFLLVGAGIYIAVVWNTSGFQERCEAHCQSQDKDSIVAPAGTVGKSIEGGRDLTDPNYQCSCIKRNNKL